MRYILLVLFAFVTTFASAQVQFLGSPTTTVRNRGNFVSDSLFYLPKRQVAPSDTAAMRYAIADSSVYVWTGNAWRRIGRAGASFLSVSDTSSMLSPYIRAAGNGLTKSGQSLLVDTLTISTRAWRRKGLDSLAALELSLSDTASMLTPYTRGSGTTNYLPKFTGSRTFGNSVAFDNGSELLIGTTTDAGAYALQVAGATYIAGTLAINTNGDTRTITTNKAASSQGQNMFVGGGGASLTYTSGADASFNNSFGINSLASITTGYSNNAYGNGSLQYLTTGAENNAFGFNSGRNITSGGMNVAMGHVSLGTASTVVGSVAIGERAMGDGATTGSYNVGVGSSALRNVTSGALNTGIGLGTLRNITTGNNLVALGAEAGRYLNNASNNVTSSNSVYVGYNTRASADGNTNENVFGNDARGNGSNTTTIGNTSTVGTYFPAGEMYVNTTTDAGAYALQVSGAIYNTTGAVLAASSGGLLIGTTSFSDVNDKLQMTSSVVGASGMRITNLSLDAAATSRITFDTQGGAFYLESTRNNNEFKITRNTTEVFRINGSGNVGIGTSTPSQPLHVNGNILTAAPSGGTAKPFKIGEAATVSPTSPNRTIRVEIDGTVYYIHAKTTND